MLMLCTDVEQLETQCLSIERITYKRFYALNIELEGVADKYVKT